MGYFTQCEKKCRLNCLFKTATQVTIPGILLKKHSSKLTQLSHNTTYAGLSCLDTITEHSTSSIGDLKIVRYIVLCSVGVDLYIDRALAVIYIGNQIP